MKKTILIILFLSVVIGASYYLGTRTTEMEYIEIIVDLTDSEKLQVRQEARLNWIHLDSAWALVGEFAVKDSTDKIRWVDSTHWSFKDSLVLNIKDSTNIVYIPFYEGRDTTIKFDETVEDTRVQLSLAVKPRFFPTFERFVTDVQMKSLTLTKPKEVESWWKHRWTIGIGYGIGFYKRTTTTRTIFINDDNDRMILYNGDYEPPIITTETQWRFDHGGQIGIYYRLF